MKHAAVAADLTDQGLRLHDAELEDLGALVRTSGGQRIYRPDILLSWIARRRTTAQAKAR